MASSAGTCSIVEENSPSYSVKKIKWSWVAGSGSSVNSITTPTTTYAYNGKLQVLHTVGAAGSSAPSASYDITIKDQSSVDVLAGAGGSRAAATEHTVAASMGAVVNDTLTLTIANTGSSNAGTVYLFIR